MIDWMANWSKEQQNKCADPNKLTNQPSNVNVGSNNNK